MTLYYEEEGALLLPLEGQKTAEAVIERALDVIGCPYEAEVSLLLTMDEQIQKMNTEFRGIECSTDVLSFPMIDYPGPGEFGFLDEREDCFDPESGELSLGDIVISKAGAGIRTFCAERVCVSDRTFRAASDWI